jgi:expansin (peptidoglycan-binding protein)
MFHFPSGKPKTHKPSNKYRYNRKTRQAIAIQAAQVQAPEPIETIYLRDLFINPTANLLDLSINELEQLLKQH